MRVDMQESQSQSWNNTTLFRLLPVRNWTIASTGINPPPHGSQRGGGAWLCCWGIHNICFSWATRSCCSRYGLCHILASFSYHQTANGVSPRNTFFFLPFFSFCLRGAGAVFQKPRRMHKHKTSPSESWALQVDDHHGGSLEGFQAGLCLETATWGGKHSGVLSGQSSRLSRPRFRLSPLDLAAGDLGCK